jgi:hypothetical protein
MKKDRCWKGYKPVAGKEPYSSGSCKKAGPKKPASSKPKGKAK